MSHEYGACSGTFRLPAVGSTTVVKAPIEWGSRRVPRSIRKMRVTGDKPTGSTSGARDSTTADATRATRSRSRSRSWTWSTAA